ncbi:MAG: hypothetical protein WKF85_05405 [Chitinophagaceae bacterium]
MKYLNLLIIVSGVLFLSGTAIAQEKCADPFISSKPLIDDLDKEKTYSIFITHYVEFASSLATLQLIKEADGYYATYTDVFDNRFMKTKRELSKVKISDKQLFQFRSFEVALQTPSSGGDSQSLTIYTIRIGNRERQYKDDYYQFKGVSEMEKILRLCAIWSNSCL